ncbi:MAG: hypothetical protein CL586_02855 [Alteromonadaceae bacterium]|nr:hypothetical protein [Alteromonadaceae bacterium]
MQELLRHNDLQTTQTYTHVFSQHHSGTVNQAISLACLFFRADHIWQYIGSHIAV